MPDIFNVIPSATLTTPISLPSYGTLANTAPSPSDLQLTLSAANAPIRYSYGLNRIAPWVINVIDTAAGDVLLDCLIGQGPIGGVVQTRVNNEALPAGVTVTVYDGTQVAADSALVAAWLAKGVTYADVRPNIAYAVIKIPAGLDLPLDARSFVFEVQGLKCFDPRNAPIAAQSSLEFTQTHAGGGGNNYTYRRIMAPSYVIPSGAKLVYDFWIDPRNPVVNNAAGAIEVDLTASPSNGRSASWVDTLGDVCVVINATGAHYVAGVWYTRTLPFVASMIGKTISSVDLVNECDTAGFYRSLYRNIRIVDSGGATLLTIWAGGAPALNVDAYSLSSSGANAAEVQGLVYTTNPALHLANYLSDPSRGPGVTLNDASVVSVANRCDELLAGARRYTAGLTIDTQQQKGDVEEVMRGAAGCYVVREGPTTYLVADAPVDTSTTLQFAAADWLPQTLRYTQRDAKAAPNRISVRYTNTGVEPWGEAYTDPVETADVTAGLVDAVEMVVNATWVQNFAEAVRLRQRYAAEHSLGLKGLEFEVFEKGWKLRRGDVIRLTNGVDLVDKPVRVQKITALGFARLKITGQEYQSAMYSDDTPSAPTWPTTSLPNPRVVLAVSGLTITEEVFLDQSQSASIASAAKYASRFRCTWTASADRYLLDNVLRFKIGTTLIFEGASTGTEYVSPPVQQGKSYTLEVQARNVLGFLAPIVTKSATALGKLLVPGAVPNITQALELGGEVLLAWDPAPDIDVLRYEWRYTPNVTSGGSWDSATLIDRVDGLRARFKGLVIGTHRFYVKPIDSVPQYSTNATTVDITVTSDANAFLQALSFVSPTLSAMIFWQREGENHQRWLTNHAASWNTLFSAAMSTYTSPLATYFNVSGGISSWIGESQDMGALITGTWSLTPNDTTLASGYSKIIQTSPDGTTWTDRATLPYVGSARYVRPKIAAGSAAGCFSINAPPQISVSALTKKESGGPVTSSASVASTISLAGKYAKAARITITPRGTVARMTTLDNVVLSTTGANSFDVYLYDQAGTQVASDYDWSFEGV